MAKLERIGIDVRSKLQIDVDTGQLYWDGQRVITDTMIDLPTWVDFALGAAAIAGVIHVALTVADRFSLIPPKATPTTPQTSSRGDSDDYSGTQTRQDTSEGADD